MLTALVMLSCLVQVCEAQHFSNVRTVGLSYRNNAFLNNDPIKGKEKVLRDTLRKNDPTKGEYPDCSVPSNVRWDKNNNGEGVTVAWDGLEARAQSLHYEVRYRMQENDAWKVLTVSVGQSVNLDMSLKSESKLWVEVRKLCFDAQSNEWIKSKWVATDSEGRATSVVPCKVPNMIVQDVWNKAVQIKIPSIVGYTNWSYQWDNGAKVNFVPVQLTINGSAAYFVTVDNAPTPQPSPTGNGVTNQLKIYSTQANPASICENLFHVNFTCDIGTEAANSVATRYKGFTFTPLNSGSGMVLIDGDNANISKGMYYKVIYQTYNLATQQLYGSPKTVSIPQGKEVTLTNLGSVTYEIKVQLWYPDNNLCKEIKKIVTMPSCGNDVSVINIGNTSAEVIITPSIVAPNLVWVQLFKNGVAATTKETISSGNSYVFTGLEPGSTYELKCQFQLMGFICPEISKTFTTTASCDFFKNPTFSIEGVSINSVKLITSIGVYPPSFSYDIKWRVQGSGSGFISKSLSVGNNILIDGLIPFTPYEFVIVSKAGVNECNTYTKTYTIDCALFNTGFTDYAIKVQNNSAAVQIQGLAAGNGISYLVEHRENTGGGNPWSSQIISSGLASQTIPLIYGKSYEVKVTMKLNDLLCKSLGPKSFGLFDCKDFTSAKDSLLTYNGSFLVMNGPAVDSVSAGTYYTIRYKEQAAAKWTALNCIKGKVFELKNLKSDTKYEVEITLILKNSTLVCTPFVLSFKTLPFVVPNALKCGGGAISPNNLSQIPYPSQLINGDVITMFGFPIELLGITTINNGEYNGAGLLQVPFADSAIHVMLNNVKINDLKQGIGGTITSTKDPNNKVINFGGGTLNFGGSICVKKPESTDANGFDDDGNYVAVPPYQGYQAGMPIDSTKKYDPCGFDKNGKHKDTDDDKNSEGCGRDEIKAGKAGCVDCYKAPNAYSWLGATGPGAALFAKIKDSLKTWTIREIGKLKAANQDSISKKDVACNTFRNNMRARVTQLQYDSIFIYGQERQYFLDGLANNFEKKPELIQFESTARNTKTIELEKFHINLYECDVQLTKFKMMDTLLDRIVQEPELTNLLNIIGTNIKSMNKQDSAKYSDPKAMKGKINAIVDGQVKNRVSGGKITTVTKPTILESKIGRKKPNLDSENTLYGAGIGHLGMSSSLFLINPVERLKRFFTRNKGEEEFSLKNLGEKELKVNTVNPLQAAVYMPVIKKKIVAGKNYSIFFDNIILTPSSGVVDVAIEIPIPNKNVPISFSAKSIGFGVNGFTTANGKNPQLALNTDIEIAVTRSLMLILKGKGQNNPGTYVEFDCEGFAGIGIEANVEVCRNYLIPVDIKTLDTLSYPKRVSAHINSFFIKSWDDFMIDNVTIDPFKIVGAEQMVWKVSGITLDLSETQKGTIKYSPSYALTYPAVATPAWKGFYMANLSVVMPEGLGKDDKLTGGNGTNPGTNPKSLEIGVKECIFDKNGFTGEVFVQNILKLEDGTLGGWAFSMDTISINIEANALKGGRFSGLVNIPLFKNSDDDKIKEEDCVKYTARVLPGNEFEFIVTPPASEMKANVWKAKVVLTKGTAIHIKYKNKKFTAEATLSGDIEIDGDIGKDSKITVPKVHFENMVLSNKKPYVSNPGTWKFPNELAAKFSGFELEFKNIHTATDTVENLVGVGFGCGIKLAPGDGINITASGNLVVLGKIVEGKHQRWTFQKIKVKQVHIDATFKENHIKGGLVFYDNDPGALKWGKGFRGYLDAKFGALNVDVKAIAQFGKTTHSNTDNSEYRYFMVDAMINLGVGIDLAPGFKLKGFGGGITYHMERLGFVGTLDSNITKIDTTQFASLGQSLSKVQYTPNQEFGLGLKATVAIAATAEKAFSANVSLEVLMNDPTAGGGIAKIVLSGNARFMSDFKIKALPSADKTPNASGSYNGAPVSAYASIEYNFNNKEFKATLQVAVNGADGSLTGGGQADMLINKNTWYINIGTPNSRITLITKVKVIGEIGLSAYLDLGKGIPTMPSLPDYVQSITGFGNIVGNESKRATGRGFAFGASANFHSGFEVWKIYGSLDINLGFDMMMQDYGKTTTCSNNDNNPIGINGWYASGQFYAFIGGTVGIKHKGKQYPLGSLAVAAALQAKLPNPFYARGALAVKYSVLGGLVKGSTKVAFEVGEECKINSPNGNSNALNLAIIGDIEPSDNQRDLSLMTQPKVNFNVPINVKYINQDKDGMDHEYTAKVIENKLYSFNSQTYISFSAEEFSKTKESVIYRTFNTLPGNDSFRFTIKVAVYKNENLEYTEEKKIYFTTGPTATAIEEANVEMSYPLRGQYNFFKEQIVDGTSYIKLRFGQSDLLSGNINGQKVKYYARYYAKGDTEYDYQPISYDFADKKISYSLNKSKIKIGKMHKIEIVAISDAESINKQLAHKYNYEKVLYSMFFRASEYNTFGEKIAALNKAIEQNATGKKLTPTLVNGYNQLIRFELGDNFEPFDRYEIYGGNNVPPLIHLTTKLEDNLIHKKHKDDFARAVTTVKGFFKQPDYYAKFVDLGQYQNGLLVEVNESIFEKGALITTPKQYLEYGLDEVFHEELAAYKEDVTYLYKEFLDRKEVCGEFLDNKGVVKDPSGRMECEANQSIEDALKLNDEPFSEFQRALFKNEIKLENISGDYIFQATYFCTKLNIPDSEQVITAKK